MLATTGDTVVRSLHLISAAVWAGGLVFLGLAVGVARRTIPDQARIEFFRSLGRRFAVVGGLALLVLIATGSDMASDRDVWGHLTDTSYGKTLLAKLVLVSVVVVLTIVHSVMQGPSLSRMRQIAAGRLADADLARQIRRRAITAGIVSGLNLLATLAILVLAARLLTL